MQIHFIHSATTIRPQLPPPFSSFDTWIIASWLLRRKKSLCWLHVNWSICSPPCLCTVRKSHHSYHSIFRSHVYARCSYPRAIREPIKRRSIHDRFTCMAHFSIIRLLIVPLVPPSPDPPQQSHSMVLLLCLYINSIGTERSFGKYQVLKK